jgi:hypothetical protein
LTGYKPDIILTILCPEDGERELWTHELRSKMLRSFGFEETALALFESDLGDRGTNAGRRGDHFSELEAERVRQPEEEKEGQIP